MDFIAEKLRKIRAVGGYRELNYLEAAQGPYTVLNGKKVLLLASNNYLGLCDDERVKAAAIAAIERYGVGSGGSRLTTGSSTLHKLLEEELAEYKATESSMVFNTGYMANLGTIAGLTDESWTIFCDRLNHGSIIDGCRLSKAKFVVYKHCDMADLEKKLNRYRGKYNLIVTDGVFSMDGDIAPLDEIVKLAKSYGAFTMVDDAHATGVLGENGTGTPEYFGLKHEIDIQMGTLSKALAAEGGYIAGSRELIEYLRHSAKSFVYSTALSPAVIASAHKAIQIVRADSKIRVRLIETANWLRAELKALGFEVLDGITPIIPLQIGAADLAMEFSHKLLERGLYIPAIRPPTVPEGSSRLRITIMATHSKADIEIAIENIKSVGIELGIIGGNCDE